jgi:hypothetical protein
MAVRDRDRRQAHTQAGGGREPPFELREDVLAGSCSLASRFLIS